jgi:pimeloyl-ACP methyl ester carboxylesterase
MSTPIPGPTSRIYFSQRLRLHYVDWGNPEAPPLLMLHGGRDHCRNWDWVAERLREDWHIIAPDLRGHGDSAWSPDGNYAVSAFVYDLAQLIHQQKLAPLAIMAHSLGAHIALRYAGIYPDHVTRLVAIEGVWPPPSKFLEREAQGIAERMRDWIDRTRALSGRQSRRYDTLEDAFKRMQSENKHLSPAQALHLTQHGVNQNEDGTFSWKFDNYVRAFAPHDVSQAELEDLWRGITCPVLHVYGRETWMPNPETEGRTALFRDARVLTFDHAGHWVHHDRLDDFTAAARAFLAE